jgi:hypothetical protein
MLFYSICRFKVGEKKYFSFSFPNPNLTHHNTIHTIPNHSWRVMDKESEIWNPIIILGR